MGIRKTDRDIRCEARARELNERLACTKLEVIGGGRKGPYTLIVGRLSYKDLIRFIKAISREHVSPHEKEG